MMRILFCGLNPSKAGWPDGDLTVMKLVGFSARIVGAQRLYDAAGARGDVPITVTGGGATFSDDRRYRYRLWRIIDTPCRLVRFDLVNLSALISTDPEGLKGTADPIGPELSPHIDAALAEADMVIAAWGSLAARPAWLRHHGETVLRVLTRLHDVRCLGKTADGSPRHPSRLAYSTPLELFRARREPVERRDRAAEFVSKSIAGGFASVEDFL